MIEMSSKLRANTALTKPPREKMVAGQQHHQHRHPQVMHLQMGEEQRQDGDDQPTASPRSTPPTTKPMRMGMRRHWRHQQFLDVALELAAEEARHHIAVAVGDHRHHDQPRHDVFHVAEAAHVADLPADQVTEDDEVQNHGDRRRQQGLRPRCARNGAPRDERWYAEPPGWRQTRC